MITFHPGNVRLVGLPQDEVGVDVDALDRRSAENVARSADLLRAVERGLHERRSRLDEIDDALRRVRELTEGV